jgi:hypothetical protein
MPLESVGEIQAPDLRNGTIAATLQQLGYSTTEDFVIEKQATQIKRFFITT